MQNKTDLTDHVDISKVPDIILKKMPWLKSKLYYEVK